MQLIPAVWLAAFVAIGCDKAKADFELGQSLEGTGDVIAAGQAYERAVDLDSKSSCGKGASDRLAALNQAIETAEAEQAAAQEKTRAAELAALKITESWCVQMSGRIFQRYFEEEQGEQASRPPSQRHPAGYLEQVIRDHTNNAQVNCKDDAFKGRNGDYWKCIWNRAAPMATRIGWSRESRARRCR